MQFDYDIEVVFHFIKEKEKKIFEGYRPAHMVQEGYLTTGVHSYYDMDNSADEIKGVITFISPEDYPNCLWVGKRIEMYEGSKVVGYAIITQIFNPILDKENLHKR